MDYKKQKIAWRKRREKVLALIEAGVSRKAIAKRLGFSRQRLSQIENGK
jgi:transcriptional regulator with XRE-family HTH domain